MTKNNEQITKNKGMIDISNVKGVRIKINYSLLVDVFCLSVFIVEISKRRSSLQSFIMLSYSSGVRILVSFSKSSQYSVSAHSFKEIVAFDRNSFLLIEYWASVRFAPIDVPDFKSCLASTYSCLSSQRYLYRLYILIANLRLFSSAMFILISRIYKTRKKDKENRDQGKRE